MLRNTNARHATNLDTLLVNVSKESNTHNTRLDNLKLIKYMSTTYMMTQRVIHQMLGSSEDSFCLQVRIWKQHSQKQQIPKLTHLITNIAYWLKQHHTRNQYLRARIDTSAEINFIPVSVYRLIYHDLDLTKLTLCNFKNQNIYNRYHKDHQNNYNLFTTPRQQEVSRNNFLHCIK